MSGPGHNSTPSIPEEPEQAPLRPPPLPPRRRPRDSLGGDLGLTKRASEPPRPPPRPDSTVPPPVPPRRDSMPVTVAGPPSSLPRSQSVCNPRPFVHHTHVNVVHGNTLPRHSSERYNSVTDPAMGLPYASSSSSSVFDVNGEEAVERPVLPPRTYKSHSRKQSS